MVSGNCTDGFIDFLKWDFAILLKKVLFSFDLAKTTVKLFPTTINVFMFNDATAIHIIAVFCIQRIKKISRADSLKT